MGKFVNLTGQTFGFLEVVSEGGRTKAGKVLWVCRCKCGEVKHVPTGDLKSGNTKSCGCLATTVGLVDNRTKRYGNEYTYMSYQAMKTRCLNPNYEKYRNHGGRGIKICERWLESFNNFFDDMGVRPDGLTLDRIDNEGDYEPSNCKWSTAKEQANNKRNSK